MREGYYQLLIFMCAYCTRRSARGPGTEKAKESWLCKYCTYYDSFALQKHLVHAVFRAIFVCDLWTTAPVAQRTHTLNSHTRKAHTLTHKILCRISEIVVDGCSASIQCVTNVLYGDCIYHHHHHHFCSFFTLHYTICNYFALFILFCKRNLPLHHDHDVTIFFSRCALLSTLVCRQWAHSSYWFSLLYRWALSA